MVAVTATPDGFECIVKSPTRGLVEAFLRRSQVAEVKVAAHDGGGNGGRALTGVWAGGWPAVPRIRSAVLATRPLRPYAHQDEAVFGDMLAQPRLRFLLADEPGTGKTIMTGMYLAEGRRRGLIPGRTVIVVPAHLVEEVDPRPAPLLRHRGRPASPRSSAATRSTCARRRRLGRLGRPVHLQPRRTPQGGRRPGVLVAGGLRRGASADPDLAVPERGPRSWRPAPTTCCCSPPPRTAARSTSSEGCCNLLDPTLYPWDASEGLRRQPLRPARCPSCGG